MLSATTVYQARPLSTARDIAITSSDVPTVCGENPFQNRKDCLFKKSLRLRGSSSPACEWGHKYEPVAIDKLKEHCGGAATVHYPDYTLHKKYHWLGGTVDGIITFSPHHNEKAERYFQTQDINYMAELAGKTFILEVKCPIKRTIHTGVVPVHYMGQLQTYMEIMDLPGTVFLQYRPPKVRAQEIVSVTFVHRDVKYMELRLPYLYDFYLELIQRQHYVDSIAVLIQRTWRAHRARLNRNRAALKLAEQRQRFKDSSFKISGFYRERMVNKFKPLEMKNYGLDEGLVYVIP